MAPRPQWVQATFEGLRWGVAIATGYECVSICANKTPTLSQLTKRYPAIGVVLVLGLIAHLLWPIQDPSTEKREERGKWQLRRVTRS